MNKLLKRMTALALALFLIVGQLAIPTAADEIVTQETLDLPTISGGTETETVDVTVTTDNSGGVTATMTSTSEGGYVTESNLTVEVSGTSTDNNNGSSESELTYEGSNDDGTYEFTGGTEVTVETPDPEDLTVDILTPPSF